MLNNSKGEIPCMNLFDIVGPVMVGPSSSHTAGAVKIGETSLRLLNEPIAKAQIDFHGSFLATGKGHGTDRALVAGLLGFRVDDERIPDAFAYAEEAGMKVITGAVDLGPDANPNSVRLRLTGIHGKQLEIIAASIGGGRIQVQSIDGLRCVFSGSHPTLIVQNDDTPGEIAYVADILSLYHINIATLQLDRDSRGGHGMTVVETDQEIPQTALDTLAAQRGILKVTYLPGAKED